MNAGALTEYQAAAGHSLAPDHVRWQSSRNRDQLERERLDLALLHNPERSHFGDRRALQPRYGTRSRSWKRRRRPGT